MSITKPQLPRRIGKALLQYFKPIQVLADGEKSRFKLFTLRKPKKSVAEKTVKNLEIEAQDEQAIQTLQASVPTQWLDLVLNLLTVCKKASLNIRNIVALNTYRRVFGDKGKSNLRTGGGIVNMTTTIKTDRDTEKL